MATFPNRSANILLNTIGTSSPYATYENLRSVLLDIIDFNQNPSYPSATIGTLTVSGGATIEGATIINSTLEVAESISASSSSTIAGVTVSKAATVAGTYPKLYDIAIYDFSVQGGVMGTISLGRTLPTNAVITKVSYRIGISPTSATDTGTIKLLTGESTDLTTNLTADGTATGFEDGVPDTTASSYILIEPGEGLLSVEIASEDLTAGIIEYYIEYYLSTQ